MIDLTGDTFANWGKLCGRYFRFPVDVQDEEEMDDVYWDEDYNEGIRLLEKCGFQKEKNGWMMIIPEGDEKTERGGQNIIQFRKML